MSRFLLALAFVFSLAAFVRALATGSSADSLLVSGKQMLRAGENGGSLDAMYAARATFERILADTSLAAWGHYYIALADYRIADYLLAAGEENKGAASEHLKTTVEHLQKATEINPQAAEAYCPAIERVRTTDRPQSDQGHDLGTQSRAGPEKSGRNLHPIIRAWCCARLSATLTLPECLVAARKRACKDSSAPPNSSPEKSRAILIQPAWGHSRTYAWLGLAYQDRGELALARAAFAKALAINPDFSWVKNVLLPELEKAVGKHEQDRE